VDTTTEEGDKALTLRGFEERFNKEDYSVVDELLAGNSEDHQEAPGTDFAEDFNDVITRTRGVSRPAFRGAPHTGRVRQGRQPFDDDAHAPGQFRGEREYDPNNFFRPSRNIRPTA
jgi:hypothetical protein